MRKPTKLPKTFGTTRRAPNRKLTGREVKSALTESQRDKLVRAALTRFVRDKSKPEELETLRYNLIVARVMSGMTAVEAAEKLGYANSTQLSLIESGERKTPDNYRFLLDAARVYSCSIDFLLGLSPHMEPDGKVAHEYAITRGMEDISRGIASMLATAMIQYTNAAHPVAGEYERVMDAVARVDQSLNVMRERYAFDDVPGSAPLLRAIEHLSTASEPLRVKLRQFKSIESYIADVREGRMPSIPYLTERYSQHELPV